MYAITKTRTLFDMFVDNTAGESYNENRLVTRENDAGNTVLIAYGWLKIAEYDESRDVVTVFAGHKSIRSTTVSRWLNDVARVATDRDRSVVLSGESPTVNTPNEGAQYIGNYVSMDGNHSSVEQEAVETVEESLENVA